MLCFRRFKISGFTLIELMVVVAIVAILAAVGYPAYTGYVIRGKRSEGRTALMDAAARLERFYSDNNRYAAVNDTFPAAANITTTSENGHYQLTLDSDNPWQTFTLIAAPQTFADPQCGNLTLTNTGARGETGTTTNVRDCWGK